MTAQSDFVAQMTPYALQASAATGIDPSLVMAQWGNETAWGTSPAWQNQHNPAGIGWNGSSYWSYPDIAGGVQGWISLINSGPYTSIPRGPGVTAQQQAVALGNSPWAGGHYDDGSGPGSSLIAMLPNVGIDPTVDAQTVAAYAGGTGGSTATGTTGAAPTTDPGLTAAQYAFQSQQQATQAANQTSARSQFESDLSQWGFTPDQVAALSGWMNGEITNNTPAEQMVLDLQDPTTPQGQIFYQRFPGMLERRQNNLPPISPADYVSYETSAYQMARAAGLPAGFMTGQEVGQLIGADVSVNELSDRITTGYVAAVNAPPETQQLLNNYFGIDAGNGLAAYYLDPERALPLLQRQITAAQIGTAGQQSGIGTIGGDLAMRLAQSGITQAEARSGFSQVAPLAPLTGALPGAPGQEGVITPEQFAQAQFLGDSTAQRAIVQAQEFRKSGFAGGGGPVAGQAGTAAGSASQSGPG